MKSSIGIKSFFDKRLLLSIGYFLLGAIVFGISYTQLPLYTSNQNTYFLHGLANGGLGFLKEDWLARTVDTVPVFSFLVGMTYRYVHEYMFYVYYLLILGIYMYSIGGIASITFNINNSRAKYFTYFALVMFIHSAVFGYFSLKIFGVNLSWYLHSGVARQYVLGPVFQPSVFGVLLILSIVVFLRNKPFLAVFFLGLAVAFHFTYLLSAAVLTLSYMVMTFKETKSIRRASSIGFFAFILVLPVLSYFYIYFSPTFSETWQRSQDLLVNFLIPEHAIPKNWLNEAVYAQICIIVVALYLTRKTKLFPVMIFSFLAATILTISQILFDHNTLALVFPWRISVFVVPISTCIIVAYIVSYFFERFPGLTSKHQKVLTFLSLATIMMLVLGGAIRTKHYFDDSLKEDSVPMMDFVKGTKSPGDTYLIPLELEKFRLYTGSPIFIDSKSPAYKDIELIEWYKRLLIAKGFYGIDGNINCNILKKPSNDHGITHVVLKNHQFNDECNILHELFKDDKYGVYKVNIPRGAPESVL